MNEEHYEPKHSYKEEEKRLEDVFNEKIKEIETAKGAQEEKLTAVYNAQRDKLLEGRISSWSNTNEELLEGLEDTHNQNLKDLKVKATIMAGEVARDYRSKMADLKNEKEIDNVASEITTSQIRDIMASASNEKILEDLDAREKKHFGRNPEDKKSETK